ncbi:hypothetical protein C0J52_10541 [Blattella germanica]|nr:hypothetical protein C0J52_10541 [Blattella germanica]
MPQRNLKGPMQLFKCRRYENIIHLCLTLNPFFSTSVFPTYHHVQNAPHYAVLTNS